MRTMGGGARNRQYAELTEIYEELEQADEAAPPARLPRDRHLRAVDRGDGAAHPARRRGAEPRAVTRRATCPLRYWILWWALIVVADFVFYVLLTPIWLGLRAVAWLAEFRARSAALEHATVERHLAVGPTR